MSSYEAPRYVPLGPILSGVGSRAFLGADLSGSGVRAVALIWVPDELARDPARLARLEAETAEAARIGHANVLRVLGVARLDEGIARVTEFADGESLRRVLDEGKVKGRVLSPLVAARVAADVCAGVAAASLVEGSSAGTRPFAVHGDLRPETILLSYEGVAKVTGYGALAVAPREADGRRVVHRRDYAAPEQLRGGRAASTRATDVYAIGAVLFETLSGGALFGERTDFEAAVLGEDAPPIAADRAPEPLRKIVARCLAREPAARFADVSELRAALLEVLAGGALAGPGYVKLHLAELFPIDSVERTARRRLLASAAALSDEGGAGAGGAEPSSAHATAGQTPGDASSAASGPADRAVAPNEPPGAPAAPLASAQPVAAAPPAGPEAQTGTGAPPAAGAPVASASAPHPGLAAAAAVRAAASAPSLVTPAAASASPAPPSAATGATPAAAPTPGVTVPPAVAQPVAERAASATSAAAPPAAAAPTPSGPVVVAAAAPSAIASAAPPFVAPAAASAVAPAGPPSAAPAAASAVAPPGPPSAAPAAASAVAPPALAPAAGPAVAPPAAGVAAPPPPSAIAPAAAPSTAPAAPSAIAPPSAAPSPPSAIAPPAAAPAGSSVPAAAQLPASAATPPSTDATAATPPRASPAEPALTSATAASAGVAAAGASKSAQARPTSGPPPPPRRAASLRSTSPDEDYEPAPAPKSTRPWALVGAALGGAVLALGGAWMLRPAPTPVAVVPPAPPPEPVPLAPLPTPPVPPAPAEAPPTVPAAARTPPKKAASPPATAPTRPASTSAGGATLELTGPAGASVFIDGTPQGTTPLRAPLPLSPGRHKIRVTLGKGVYETPLVARAGQEYTLDVGFETTD